MDRDTSFIATDYPDPVLRKRKVFLRLSSPYLSRTCGWAVVTAQCVPVSPACGRDQQVPSFPGRSPGSGSFTSWVSAAAGIRNAGLLCACRSFREIVWHHSCFCGIWAQGTGMPSDLVRWLHP